MLKLLSGLGDAAAVVGVLVCLLAGLTRLSGLHYILGSEASSLFIAGTALMVFACLVKLHQLTRPTS